MLNYKNGLERRFPPLNVLVYKFTPHSTKLINDSKAEYYIMYSSLSYFLKFLEKFELLIINLVSEFKQFIFISMPKVD